MSITVSNGLLKINGRLIDLPWPVLEVVEHDARIFVLLDPDSYLTDPGYDKREPSVHNFLAFGTAGEKLWEAELPEPRDYYYKIESVAPLTVYSFSSYGCKIDPRNGVILSREFFK